MDDCRSGRRARRLIPAFVALATIVFPSLTFAQRFDEVGVRAQGMAGAFVAVADDASVTWWNPGGLATGLGLADLAVEVGEGGTRGVTVAFPSLGLSYYRLNINQIQPSGPIGPGASGRQDNGAVGLTQFGITVGHSLTDHVVVGTTAKLVNAQSDTQADVDVGAMASFGVLRMGATVRNLRNPTLGFGLDAFSLERRARAGAAAIVQGHGALDRLVVAVDADLNSTRVAGRDEQDVAGGVEMWWQSGRFGVRGGGGANTAAGGGSFGALGMTVVPYPRVNVEGAVTRGSDSGRNRWSVGVRLTY